MAAFASNCCSYSGCSESDGQRPGANSAICEEVHDDAGEHPGGVFEDPDPQVTGLDGAGHEGGHEGHDEHEQAGLCCLFLVSPLIDDRILIPRLQLI